MNKNKKIAHRYEARKRMDVILSDSTKRKKGNNNIESTTRNNKSENIEKKSFILKSQTGTPYKIFICSPLRPTSKDPDEAKRELAHNLARAKTACRMVNDLGGIPYAPHVYTEGWLDDSVTEERERGLAISRKWLMEADEVWVFSEHISEGMASEIALASELNIPVRMVSESGGLLKNFIGS